MITIAGWKIVAKRIAGEYPIQLSLCPEFGNLWVTARFSNLEALRESTSSDVAEVVEALLLVDEMLK